MLRLLLCFGLTTISLRSAEPVSIDFENLSGMPFWSGLTVPENSLLNTQYQLSQGVTFEGAAVVNLGLGHAVTGTNGFGVVDPNNQLEYSTQIKISLW